MNLVMIEMFVHGLTEEFVFPGPPFREPRDNVHLFVDLDNRNNGDFGIAYIGEGGSGISAASRMSRNYSPWIARLRISSPFQITNGYFMSFILSTSRWRQLHGSKHEISFSVVFLPSNAGRGTKSVLVHATKPLTLGPFSFESCPADTRIPTRPPGCKRYE